LCRLESCIVTDAFYRFEVLGCGIVDGLRLYQRRSCSIEIAAGDGALGKELLAALDDAQIQVKIRFGLRQIGLGLERIFRHLRLGRCIVGCFGGHVGSLVVHCRRGQIVVFEGGEELAGFDAGSALNEKFAHRRADFRLNGSLRKRRQHSIGGDVLGDGALLGVSCLHGHQRFRRGLLLASWQENERKRRRAKQHGAQPEGEHSGLHQGIGLLVSNQLGHSPHPAHLPYMVPVSVCRSALATS